MSGFFDEILIGLLLLVIGLLAAAFLQTRHRTKREGTEQRLKMELLENHYQELLERYEKKSVLVHDMRNHLHAMAQMLEQGCVRETIDYISEIIGEMRQSGSMVYTGNKMLDSILNRKLQEAREAQIQVRCECDDMRTLNLSLGEICALFANLLDNATEAAARCTAGEERRIDMACRKQGRMLVVTLANSVGEETEREPKALSRTADHDLHGFGMISVKKVIGSHDGYMKAGMYDGMFRLVLYLVGFPDHCLQE